MDLQKLSEIFINISLKYSINSLEILTAGEVVCIADIFYVSSDLIDP